MSRHEVQTSEDDGEGSEAAEAFDFKAELTALIPQLRAFARSLCGDPALADDLTQEALIKAWSARDRFEPGTNLRAWSFMILRNHFYSHRRRAWRQQQWDDAVDDLRLTAPAGQHAQLDLADLERALQTLPDSQREALILVGAGGFSYAEAAAVCGVEVGTVKSRVSRARTTLVERLGGTDRLPARRAVEEIMRSLLEEAASLGRGRAVGALVGLAAA